MKKWFKEAQYGMMAHWGLYSMLAGEWRGKFCGSYAEWIQSDMAIPNREYAQLAECFNPVYFDADEWIRLAKDAGMSEVYFRKLFHLRFGMSPSHYIMQTRISHAVKLMQLERLSLDEISEKSGFSSLPYFSKVFKAMMGESPAKYRNTLPKPREMT